MPLMRRRPRRRVRPLVPSVSTWPSEGLVAVPVDVAETDNAIVVRADLPGLRPEDIDVSVTGDRLTLKGAFKAEEEHERGNFYVCERRFGSFQRHIDLPASIDVDAAETSFKNGVLLIELPKVESAERKQIDVKRPFEEI